MLVRSIAISTLFLSLLAPVAFAQATGPTSVVPNGRSRNSDQTAATRRDGALMTHANESKPKDGHSETSAGKSGK